MGPDSQCKALRKLLTRFPVHWGGQYGASIPFFAKALPLLTKEEPSPGNGAGVQNPFGDFLDISVLKPLKFFPSTHAWLDKHG